MEKFKFFPFRRNGRWEVQIFDNSRKHHLIFSFENEKRDCAEGFLFFLEQASDCFVLTQVDKGD